MSNYSDLKLSSTTHADSNQQINILLVEDNVTAQKVTHAMLTALNYHTDIADSGTQALALFKPGKYDLILMDIGLPDISGYSVSHQIKLLENATEYHTPIISLTAYADNFSDADYAQMGIKEAITKPLSKEVAERMVKKYVTADSSPKGCENSSREPELAVIDAGADKEILGLLSKSLSQSAEDLEMAYQTGDIPTLIRIVHKLHGGLCYSNTPQLLNAAYLLEDSLHNNETNKLSALYQNFLQAKKRFEAAYRSL